MTGQDTLLRWRMAGRRPAQGVLVEVAAKRSPFVVAAPPDHSIEADGVALLTVAPGVGAEASVRISPRIDAPSETSIRVTNAVDGAFALQPLE